MSQLVHTLNSHLDFIHDGITLFSYTYNSTAPQIESPRPYFHPLRTLKGNVVSGFRPHDHRWHHGLSMTSAFLSGNNFWGGPTFADGEYRQLENNGRQSSFQPEYNIDLPSKDRYLASHGVNWQDSAGNGLIKESRSFGFHRADAHWVLSLGMWLGNETDSPLVWGSPTTQGRENAGYGGLFWRGPRDFIGGKILMSDGREGAELMGQQSPWLAYIGQHDETNDFSTLIFIDNTKNPRFPTKWFMRNTTPMVCPNFAYDEEYVQESGETLRLKYNIVVGDGAWDREQIESVVAKTIKI